MWQFPYVIIFFLLLPPLSNGGFKIRCSGILLPCLIQLNRQRIRFHHSCSTDIRTSSASGSEPLISMTLNLAFPQQVFLTLPPSRAMPAPYFFASADISANLWLCPKRSRFVFPYCPRISLNIFASLNLFIISLFRYG